MESKPKAEDNFKSKPVVVPLSFADCLIGTVNSLIPSMERGPWTGYGKLSQLRFTIPVEPKTMQSNVRINGKMMYNDKKKDLYYDTIKNEVLQHIPDKPIDHPVAVFYALFFKRPKRLLTKASPSGAIPFDQRPDYDNVAKALGDALEQAGFWLDDKRIWTGWPLCLYCEKNLFPRIETIILHEDA